MAQDWGERLSALEERVKTIREEWPQRFATRNDLDRVREECEEEHRSERLTVLKAIENVKDSIIETVKEHLPGEETRQYVAVKTKGEEQQIQIVAANLAQPWYRQAFSAIFGNKWMMAIFLLICGLLLKALIEFLQQLLILVNSATQHIWHP